MNLILPVTKIHCFLSIIKKIIKSNQKYLGNKVGGRGGRKATPRKKTRVNKSKAQQ